MLSVEWQKFFRKHFKRSPQSSSSHFHFDISCAVQGIKPVHLVDYLPPDPHRLQKFLQEVLHDKTYQGLCVLSIEEDVLFVNYASLIASRRSLPGPTPHPVFIDITRGLTRPRVMVETQVAEKLLSDCLKELEKNLPRNKDVTTLPVICHCCQGNQVPVDGCGMPSEGNVCSLFGQLLGYPVVYWFDTSKGYCLDMEKLVRHCVLARTEGVTTVSTAQTCTREEVKDEMQV